jgi:SAM-dependent methyltransferase
MDERSEIAYPYIVCPTANGEKVMQERLIQILPESILKVLRPLRTGALIAYEPLDYVSKWINGKKGFPPLYLRIRTGPLRSFEGSGGEFFTYLKLICGLRPSETILDIGCGCGIMTLDLLESQGLPEYLRGGKYVGGDIHKGSIKWCQRKISRKYPNCVFFHMDIKNIHYNPQGQYAAENYVFPFEDNSFDVVILKSVFTHMLPAAVDNYLKEIRRLLSDRGHCLATVFLLNEEQYRLAKQGLNRFAFKFGDENVRYVHKDWLELAVGYNEEFIKDLITRNELVVDGPIRYGTWSGIIGGLSFQDIVVLRRRIGS